MAIFVNDTMTIVHVSAWEREIHELVYGRDGLTPEEIELVEGSAK
jgi:hypothetical protein